MPSPDDKTTRTCESGCGSNAVTKAFYKKCPGGEADKTAPCAINTTNVGILIAVLAVVVYLLTIRMKK